MDAHAWSPWARCDAEGGEQAVQELLRRHAELAASQRVMQLAIAAGIRWRRKGLKEQLQPQQPASPAACPALFEFKLEVHDDGAAQSEEQVVRLLLSLLHQSKGPGHAEQATPNEVHAQANSRVVTGAPEQPQTQAEAEAAALEQARPQVQAAAAPEQPQVQTEIGTAGLEQPQLQVEAAAAPEQPQVQTEIGTAQLEQPQLQVEAAAAPEQPQVQTERGTAQAQHVQKEPAAALKQAKAQAEAETAILEQPQLQVEVAAPDQPQAQAEVAASLQQPQAIATALEQLHVQTEAEAAAPDQSQAQACITNLPPAVIAHIGTFCDEAARRAASESHRCFAAIHQYVTEHTWVFTVDRHGCSHIDESEPASDHDSSMLTEVRAFMALLHRKPRLQTLKVNVESVYTSLTADAYWALAHIACHVPMELRLPYGYESHYLEPFNKVLQLVDWAYSAAAARAHGQPQPELSPYLQGFMDWLSEQQHVPAEHFMNMTVKAALTHAKLIYPARAPPAQDVLYSAFLATIDGIMARADKVEDEAATRSEASYTPAPRTDFTDAATAPRTDFTDAATALPLGAHPSLAIRALYAHSWDDAANSVNSLAGGLIHVDTLFVNGPPRTSDELSAVGLLCSMPYLTHAVRHLQVHLGVLGAHPDEFFFRFLPAELQPKDLTHTVPPEQLAVLAGLSQVTVAFPAAPNRLQASHPLVVHCATDVVLALTSSSMPHIVSLCTRAKRLRVVVVDSVEAADLQSKCELVQQLDAQLPAHLAIALGLNVLSSPDAVEMVLSLLDTPPTLPCTTGDCATSSTRDGCPDGHQPGGEDEGPADHLPLPKGRRVELHEYKFIDNDRRASEASCAALVYQLIRARLEDRCSSREGEGTEGRRGGLQGQQQPGVSEWRQPAGREQRGQQQGQGQRPQEVPGGSGLEVLQRLTVQPGCFRPDFFPEAPDY